MALPEYGLLIGKITASRPKRPGNPHWLLFVQPGDTQHPPYRVAVNLQETEHDKAPELQYRIVKFGGRGRAAQAGNALVKTLTRLRTMPSFMTFVTADSDPSVPRLDFVRGGIFDPDDFTDLPAGSNSLREEFEAAVNASEQSSAAVAVFGTGYPIDQTVKRGVPTGFTGIENVHMNQGALNQINSAPHYLQNGPNQDGGIIFLFPDGAKGFFVKFRSQMTSTDAKGNPTITGIDEIDKTTAAVRKVIMPPIRGRALAARRRDPQTSAKRAARPRATSSSAPAPRAAASPSKTNPSGTTNDQGYVFADFDPNDSSGKYIPDNDADTYQTPFVQQLSKGQTRGPVPTPRVYPRLDLAAVVGANPPGYAASSAGKSIAFDIVGDSGAPTQQKLDEYEVKVTELMSSYAAQSPPTFLYHVGDVVYFYGEENYYYSQFYEPFKAYPAPIFAIPGNHDGMTYNATMTSLDSFQKAFCSPPPPGRWVGAGGILRSTLTQPGVYFTLDHPLVSIIGLYSNCGESLGWLNDAQLMFLYQELVRLKALRAGGLPAVMLAIHHFPRWFPGEKDPTSTAIDATCKKAGFWPDAVICGHAHLYQRIVRQDTGQDIPYFVVGAGGYAITPGEEVGKTYVAQLMKNGTQLANKMFESGFARATLTSPSHGDPTLRFEYRSVKPKSNGPDDVCTINLRTNKLV
jgi:uncharacterized protein YukJ